MNRMCLSPLFRTGTHDISCSGDVTGTEFGSTDHQRMHDVLVSLSVAETEDVAEFVEVEALQGLAIGSTECANVAGAEECDTADDLAFSDMDSGRHGEARYGIHHERILSFSEEGDVDVAVTLRRTISGVQGVAGGIEPEPLTTDEPNRDS